MAQGDRGRSGLRRPLSAQDTAATTAMRRYVAALYDVLSNAIGAEKMVLRAGKLDALRLMRSNLLPERILALAAPRLRRPDARAVAAAPASIARRSPRSKRGSPIWSRSAASKRRSKSKVNAKMAERHQDYLKDLKLEALREDGGPETPATQKKLEDLHRARRAQAGRVGAARCCARRRSTTSSANVPRSRRCSPRSRRRFRSTSSCTGRRASARRPSRGSRSKSRSAVRTRPSLPTRRSSKRAARRCAGMRARRPIRCSAACTIRSIKAAAAISPRAAFPSRSSVSSPKRTAACCSSTSSARWIRSCRRSCSRFSKTSASSSNRRTTIRATRTCRRTSRSCLPTARRRTSS